MPQLDKITFSSQVFWLLVTFFSMHYLFLKQVLPTIAASLKYRQYILASYAKARDEVASEKSKLSQLQKDSLSTPVLTMQKYLNASFQQINLELLQQSATQFKTVVDSSKTPASSAFWGIYNLRLRLRALNII